jgi:hypothetical protein
MKRILLYFLVLILFILAWFGESRRFFCLESGECITVWKTYNNVCFIIPGKYYGIFRPSGNYIETSNSNNLTIYFTREFPNSLIYKSENVLVTKNDIKQPFVFYDYNTDTSKFDEILYLPNAKKNNDLKDNAQFIEIFTHENFALDKHGNKL